MSEQPTDGNNLQSRDPQANWVLAEEMAYAEKPYQEDAIALGGLIRRAHEVQGKIREESDARAETEKPDERTNRSIRMQDQATYASELSSARDYSLSFANYASSEVVRSYQPPTGGSANEGRAGTVQVEDAEQTSPEAKFSPEQLKELLDSNPVIAAWRYKSYEHITRNPHGKKPDWSNGSNERITDTALRQATNFPGYMLYQDEIYGEGERRGVNLDNAFRSMEVPEVVTLAEFRSQPRTGRNAEHILRREIPSYGIIDPKSPKAAERVFALSYATIRGEERDGKFPHPTYAGNRSGSYVSFRVLLPESDAIKLFEQMRDDPTVARQAMADIVQLNGLGLDIDELQAKNILPPYDKWREDCGGKGRMAFRTAFNQLPKDSEIVEF